MAVIRPAALNPAETIPSNAAIPIDTGSEVAKATPEQIVDAAIPLASESEAVEGSDNTKRVTPLRVKQAMDANMATTAALASSEPGKGAEMVGYEGRTLYLKAKEIGVSPEDHLVGGAVTQASIEAAIAEVEANEGYHLLFNRKEYGSDDTIDLSGVKVTVSNGGVIVPSHDGTAVLYAGASGSRLLRPCLEGNLRVAWDAIDWSEDRVAFFIQNAYFGRFNISWANATRGLVMHSDEIGCVYNNVYIDEGFRALVGIHLSSESATGWTNSNRFEGGRLYGSGDVSGTLYESVASHIYIDDSVYSHNGNEFRLALEWSSEGFRLARLRGLRNFLRPRYAEMDDGDTTWIVDTGTENTIDCEGVPYLAGYDPTLSGANNRIDVSGATRPIVRGQQAYHDAGGIGSFVRKIQSASRPAILGQNGSSAGPAIRAQNTSSSAGPGIEVVNTTGGAGVSIPAAGTWTVYNGTKKVVWSSSAAPASGTWTRGDIAWATNPSSGGPVGWVCVTGGTPGTWAAFGILGASRAAAVADPAGGSTVDTECRTQLAALIDALQTAGLMATS